MSTKPSPQTWTLRIKNNRTTLLLHVDPLQKLSSVKSEILKAVQQTHPDGHLNGITIPTQAEDILLAKPIDINDLSVGWEPLEPHADKLLEGGDSGKGKGKAVAGSSTSKKDGAKNSAKDSPQGAGLRDGGIVAFKFRTERERMYAEWKRVDGDEDGDESMLAEEESGEEWDVVVPTLEETYGESLPVVEHSEEGG